jgi:hypothetical protein
VSAGKLRKSDVPFAQVPWVVLQDARLSFAAVGIFAYILSLPDNWEVSVERLAGQRREGYAAVKRAVDELISAGLYHRINVRQTTGRKQVRTYVLVTNQPMTDAEAAVAHGLAVDNSGTDSPVSGTPSFGDPENRGVIEKRSQPAPTEQVGEEIHREGPNPPAAPAGTHSENNNNATTEASAWSPSAALTQVVPSALHSAEGPGDCWRHRDKPHASCRRCGTSPREVDRRQRKTAKRLRCDMHLYEYLDGFETCRGCAADAKAAC